MSRLETNHYLIFMETYMELEVNVLIGIIMYEIIYNIESISYNNLAGLPPHWRQPI